MKKYSKLIFTLTAVVLLSACSSKSDKEFFEAAQKNVTEEKYTEAITQFEMLVEEHSGSDLAPKALAEIAKLYHAKLVPNLNSEESLKKSVVYYKRIFDEYAESPEAEYSLFMSGFVKANDINDIESAKKDYELFLKNFPKSQLAESVKIEMENLGKHPEDYLQEKVGKAN